MKTNYLFLMATIAFMLVGCSKNEKADELTGEPASITISLKGNSSETKATGTPTQAQENTINNFTVFVYNGNLLEKSKAFTSSPALTQTITGLRTGAKKVVVIANIPTGYDIATDSSYTSLATDLFDLGTQTSSTNLTMSGETTVTLSTGTNSASINVSRIVAKVQLGTVALASPLAPGQDGTKFNLTNVYIMKAKGDASIGIPSVTTGTNFYGGVLGTVSTTQKSYLAESRTIAAGQDNTRYFYVFPNDNATGNGTLLTLAGTYDGVTTYFPFRINNGTMARNTYYVINVTIKRPGSGSTDPEVPVDPATLDITVIPVDWILAPVQNVEW